MITIRPASYADTEQIKEVAFETWTSVYRNSLSMDFIHQFLNNAYSISNIQRLIDGDTELGKSSFLVAEQNKQVVGYAQLIQLSPSEYELYRIYIKPESQKQGIGTAFLNEFYKSMKPGNVLSVIVKKDNEMARAFYSKNGFKQTEEQILTLEEKPIAVVKYERSISLNDSKETL